MRRHWSINGRFLSQPQTGVQRAAWEIVRALDTLLASDPSVDPELSMELVAPPNAAIPSDLDVIRCRRVGRLRAHAWEQGVLPFHAPGGLLSFCNTGPLLHRKQIVCIHDANTRSFPGSYTLGFRSLYRVLIPALGRTARRVTTVSSYSASELSRLGICPARKIGVVRNGHEHAARWIAAHSDRTRSVAGGKTIVLIGSPAPHKNIDVILRLSERLRAAGFRIAVVGEADSRIFAAGGSLGQGAEWLGRLSDEEMAALLRDSFCLVFPSRTEGFGMPPLEAMTLGCPTIVSDRASLPEICGRASLYASPDDPEQWFDRICELELVPGLRDRLIARGLAQAARFRWLAAAKAYLSLMADLDQGRERASVRLGPCEGPAEGERSGLTL